MERLERDHRCNLRPYEKEKTNPIPLPDTTFASSRSPMPPMIALQRTTYSFRVAKPQEENDAITLGRAHGALALLRRDQVAQNRERHGALFQRSFVEAGQRECRTLPLLLRRPH